MKSTDYFCSTGNPAHKLNDTLTEWQTNRIDRIISLAVVKTWRRCDINVLISAAFQFQWLFTCIVYINCIFKWSFWREVVLAANCCSVVAVIDFVHNILDYIQSKYVWTDSTHVVGLRCNRDVYSIWLLFQLRLFLCFTTIFHGIVGYL